MPRILLIDDNPRKSRQLVDFLTEATDAEVVEKRSYQSGARAALLENNDLIIVDMTMPTFDVRGKETGGRERRYAGRHLLRQLQRKHLTTPTIVVTQFEQFGEGAELVTLDELRVQLAQEFPTCYMQAIYYQPADSRWREELRAAIRRSGKIGLRDKKP
jgi:CheY-like chemotaxis protein